MTAWEVVSASLDILTSKLDSGLLEILYLNHKLLGFGQKSLYEILWSLLVRRTDNNFAGFSQRIYESHSQGVLGGV